MKTSRHLRAFKTKSSVLVLLLVAAASCKKPMDASKVKTLDQFAGSSARYSCKGTYTDNEKYMKSFVNAKTPEQIAAIKDALSAVSPSMKAGIFEGPLKPKFEVTDNVTEKCMGTSIAKANSKQLQSLTACPSVKGGKATIYLDSKPDNIRSGLVRGLAYYMVHIHNNIDIGKSTSSNIVIGFSNQGDFTKNNKYQGAMIFLDEVASKGTDSIMIFDKLLPKAVLSAKTKAERDAAFMNPSVNFVGDRDAFVSYFTAELIDSGVCSDASRLAFSKTFPKTAAFFGASAPVKAGGFNLGDTSNMQYNEEPYGSNSTSDPATVTIRQPSDGVPSGFSRSPQKMILGEENSGNSSSLYRSADGKTQSWQGSDGKWRQSGVPTKENNDLTVRILDKSPLDGDAAGFADPSANKRQQNLPGNNTTWNEEPVNGIDPLDIQKTQPIAPTNNNKWFEPTNEDMNKQQSQSTQPVVNQDTVVQKITPPAPSGEAVPAPVKPTRECNYWNYWCAAPWP
jgi:hypothetical protein